MSLHLDPHIQQTVIISKAKCLIILSASKVIFLSHRVTQQSYIVSISNVTTIINLHVLKSDMLQKLTKTHTAKITVKKISSCHNHMCHCKFFLIVTH